MFSLDFTGVRASGNLNRPIPEKGLYRVRVISVAQRETNAGNQRIDFNMVVDAGKHKGCTVRDGLNILDRAELGDEKYFQRMSFWKTALLSMGVGESKLAGKVTGKTTLLVWCEKNCVGKVAHYFYEPAVNEHEWPDKKFLTPQQYDTLEALESSFEESTVGIDVDTFEEPAAPTGGRTAVVARLSDIPDADTTDPLDFIDI